MAGGGDPVSGVELLSFPQTRAGCRFEALVAVFQQAGENRKDKAFSVFLRLRRESYSTVRHRTEQQPE